MALGDDRDPQLGRRARPGPYQAPADGPRPQPEDLELARRAAISPREAQRIDVTLRDRLLAKLRADDARRHANHHDTLWQHIHATSTTPPDDTGA